MRKRQPKSVRVLTGSGYPSGKKDISQAGPIPESAGIRVKSEAHPAPPETSPPSSAKTQPKSP